MENFNSFIEEIQKLEIKVKEFYIDNDYVIEDFTVEEAPNYLYKKGFFLDLSHYNNESNYPEKLKILQQRALTELSNLNIEQINIHLNRIELILSRFSKMFNKCNNIREKFENGNFNKVDLELEIFSAFIIEKPENYNFASVTDSFFWDLLDAITVQKDGYLQGLDKQIRDIFNIAKEEPIIKHQLLIHELSQKQTITEKLNYWLEIKDNFKDFYPQLTYLAIPESIYNIHFKIHENDSEFTFWFLKFVGDIWFDSIKKTKSLDMKLGAPLAKDHIIAELNEIYRFEEKAKANLKEKKFDIYELHYNSKYQDEIEYLRIIDEYYKKNGQKNQLTLGMAHTNSKTVMAYATHILLKSFLETKLKELEQTSPVTPLLENANSISKKEETNKVVKKRTTKDKYELKLYAICDLVEKGWRKETNKTVEQLEKIYKKAKGEYAKSNQIDRSQLNTELKNTDDFEYIKNKLMFLYRENK